MAQRTSRRPKRSSRRRTSRRTHVTPNIALRQLTVPAPPAKSWQMRQWLMRTFAPGTPVKLTAVAEGWLGGSYLDVPRGARGVVVVDPVTNDFLDYYPVEDSWSVVVEITDARDEAGILLQEAVGARLVIDVEQLEPLVDNWATGAQGRRTSRHALPKSQRSWLKPNVPVASLSVPPPDPQNWRAMRHWVYTTFAVGTPVALIHPTRAYQLMAGTAKGVISAIEESQQREDSSVFVHITELRDRFGNTKLADIATLNAMDDGRGLRWAWSELVGDEAALEPLVDNWKHKQGRPASRQSLPKSQRSRMKPNIAWERLSVPPPTRGHTWGANYASWLRTTFAPGTPVKFAYDNVIGSWSVPKDARGVVVAVWDDSSVEVMVTDARDNAGPLPVVGKSRRFVAPALEPLVDNWNDAARGFRVSRHSLPRSQRSWMKPNAAMPLATVTVDAVAPTAERGLWTVMCQRPDGRMETLGESRTHAEARELAMSHGHRLLAEGGEHVRVRIMPPAFAGPWEEVGLSRDRARMSPNPYREPERPSAHKCKRWKLRYVPPHGDVWVCVDCNKPPSLWKQWRLDRKYPRATFFDEGTL